MSPTERRATLKKDGKTRQVDLTQFEAYHETPISGDKTFLRSKYKGEDDDLIEIPLDLDEDTELHDEYLILDMPNRQASVQAKDGDIASSAVEATREAKDVNVGLSEDGIEDMEVQIVKKQYRTQSGRRKKSPRHFQNRWT